MPAMLKDKLIEAELLKEKDYFSRRAFIISNKIKIVNLMGKRTIINKNEFIDVKKKQNVENKTHIA